MPNGNSATSSSDLMKLIHEAGFTGQSANIMYAIVLAESHGDATAHNTNASTGDNSYGLAQINMIGDMGPQRRQEYGLSSNDDLFDPLTNLKVAYALSNHGTNFSPWTTYTRGTYEQYLGQSGAQVTNGGAYPASAGSTALDASGAAGTPNYTASDYEAALGDLGQILTSIPELNGLLKKAVSNDWTTDKFQNEIENSDWYRSHSANAREAIAQRISDPATWDQTVNQTVQSVTQLAKSEGWSLSDQQAKAIATTGLMNGQATNQQWLLDQIGNKQNYAGLTSTDSLTGNMATTVNQLVTAAQSYGIQVNPQLVAQKAQQIIEGSATLDQYKDLYKQMAISKFPGLTDQLNKGQTVQDIADPYIQDMAGLLEVDPSTLSIDTPLVKKALQGLPSQNSGATTPQVMPLWQFEQQVRSDPRWSYTQNAHQQVASTLMSLGQAMGFEP